MCVCTKKGVLWLVDCGRFHQPLSCSFKASQDRPGQLECSVCKRVLCVCLGLLHCLFVNHDVVAYYMFQALIYLWQKVRLWSFTVVVRYGHLIHNHLNCVFLFISCIQCHKKVFVPLQIILKESVQLSVHALKFKLSYSAGQWLETPSPPLKS